MAMKQHQFSSAAYALFQITQGLLLHPYQTAQSLVRERQFAWMVWLPTITVGTAYLVWRLLVVPTVRMVFTCQQSDWQVCLVLPPISNWLVFFCLYWQLILFYLWIRFRLLRKAQ